MPWLRLEGRGAFHNKVVAAGNEAYGAWCRAGQWASDALTDGFVPEHIARTIASPKVWKRLLDVRLLDPAEGGYRIHDYLDWNLSSEQERVRRAQLSEKRRAAGRAGGVASGRARAKQDQSNGEAAAKQSASFASGNDEATAKQSASFASSNDEVKTNPVPVPVPVPVRTHTHSAGARAMASLEELGELLRGTMLQPLASDENTLRLVLGGYHMAHGDCATAELARQAVARLIGREGVRLQSASVDVLAERLGTYLTDPRLRQRAESPGGGPLPQPVREVLAIFGDEWQRQKRRAFVAADGDEQRAARLLGAAERACSEHRQLQPLDVVRRWVREYVRDQDPYLTDREHPLALLLSRLTSYGLPKVAKKQPREPNAEPERCALPPELARFGTGGGGGPVPPRKGAPKAAQPAEPGYAPPPPLESFLGPPPALRVGGGGDVPPQGGET